MDVKIQSGVDITREKPWWVSLGRRVDGALGNGMVPYAVGICKAFRKKLKVPIQICSLWGFIPKPRFGMIFGSDELAALVGMVGRGGIRESMEDCFGDLVSIIAYENAWMFDF